MTIETMLPIFLPLMASVMTWTQAKLPATSMKRKIQSIGCMTRGLTSVPVRLSKTSLSVGVNVNVKIVASTADQRMRIRNATHGMPPASK